VPELPEVETIRQNLEREIGGKRLTEIEIKGTRVARRHASKKEIPDAITGARIIAIDRRGKYLIIRFDTGKVLVVHLGMSGRLERSTPRRKLERHTHAILRFGATLEIRFIDPRTFGELFVTDADALDGVSELAHIALDPLADAFTWRAFSELVESRKVKLKQLLLDQSFVSGLGNIYSDEVLWAAGLLPDRRSDTLTAMEMRRLYRAMQEVLIEAVKAGGTTLEDEGYVNLYGQPGSFQDQLRAYGQEGKACRRCRQPIVRARWSNRSMYYCSSCQV
jgi:formamidopyrimidine-DNA glycosylase